MAEENHVSSGVQDLITRLRDEGVQAGKEEAEELLRKARQKAATIVAAGKEEIATLRKQAEADIEAQRQASLEGLQMAARDTVLTLKSQIMKSFEQYVERLVSSATRDNDLIKALVLVLAGHAVEDFIKDKELHMMVSEGLFGSDEEKKEGVRERTRKTILGLSSDMLRDGLELIPASDVDGGARVHLVKENLEIDLSDKAISQLLLKHMLPRFRAIIEGLEE